MSTMHTPGPWRHGAPIKGIRTAHVITSDTGGTVAVLEGRHGADEIAANARLIAAAPKMLVALQAAEYWLDEEAKSPTPGATKPVEILRVIRDALAGVEP